MLLRGHKGVKLAKKQSRPTKNRSCSKNLDYFSGRVTKVMDKGNNGHAIHLRLYKILETASHELLFQRINSSGLK